MKRNKKPFGCSKQFLSGFSRAFPLTIKNLCYSVPEAEFQLVGQPAFTGLTAENTENTEIFFDYLRFCVNSSKTFGTGFTRIKKGGSHIKRTAFLKDI
ncbi:MAG: hypothetical protein KDE51_16710 [Anaerolineales bacterium]|nr:hypothetical protein [Anaerolineales bacterium]